MTEQNRTLFFSELNIYSFSLCQQDKNIPNSDHLDVQLCEVSGIFWLLFSVFIKLVSHFVSIPMGPRFETVRTLKVSLYQRFTCV